MEEKAEEDEIVEEERGSPPSIASASKKRKGEAAADGAPGAGVCDDVLVSILARLPARTAISCMALSKHHRRLIRSPEFRSLHRRMAPPPPRPHVAYVATAPLRWKGERGLVSVFHGFHVAGAGRIAGSDAAPMRALFGERYLDDRYVNTCNGVVLLATNGYSRRGRCVLWNPAVADVVRDVTVPDPSSDSHYLVLGLGYGRRSQRYKLLLCRKDWHYWETIPGGRVEYSLQVNVLGEQPRLRIVSSTGVTGLDGKIQSQESLYMDGVVFILDVDKSVIAFDVDDETIATIELPGERDRGWPWHVRSTLMEMDGSLCLVTNLGDHHRAGLWQLTPDRQWELRCVIELQDDLYHREDDGSVHDCSIAGVWDCGGVLALYIQGPTARNNRLCLYQLATKKMFNAKLPCDLVPECSENYAICWGYKPTLVAPQSIVELGQDEERRRNNAAHVMEALKPINDKDSREGQKAILDTVSFVEFLVSIMRKLPDDLQDVTKELALLESKDLDLVSDNDSEDSENAGGDAIEFELVSGSEPDSD